MTDAGRSAEGDADLLAREQRPDPLRENPPADQFCDLVLNGGVASGVVYPWALLELARHYRFRNIGGNSVGAMAAALGAAAEYGRCHGYEDAFEVLRLLPLKLARPKDAKDRRTKLLRLFQPSPPVGRLFTLFLQAKELLETKPEQGSSWSRVLGRLASLYGFWKLFALATVVLGAGAALWAWRCGLLHKLLVLLLIGGGSLLGGLFIALVGLAFKIYRDLKALADNGYGICKGLGQVAGEEGLVEWLHKGIQLSAGRTEEDPPLTFADLWAAPRAGRHGPSPLPGGLQPPDAGIDLQMFASNITQGRPVRMPLCDANTRLFYDPEEWKGYFPPSVMKALQQASEPYRPDSVADPEIPKEDGPQRDLVTRLRELPSGGMPLIVAARLSLCFPVLFSCVPVYAIDYESPAKDRRLRHCLLSDGGLCTNFPVHLFDAAHPRWPTFALLLDSRLEAFADQSVWLPRGHRDGRADNWQRFVPGAEQDESAARQRPLPARLFGVAGGIILTMKDWNDRVTGRLPQVRNRIVRLALRKGEGQLNLDMPGERILHMAHEYGTMSGRKLVERFAPDAGGIKPAWREHLYVRSLIELRALRKHLRGYAAAVQSGGSTLALAELLERATQHRPLKVWPDRPDVTAAAITPAQRDAIERAVRAVEALEAELAACEQQFGPYEPVAEPEMRLRPPI